MSVSWIPLMAWYTLYSFETSSTFQISMVSSVLVVMMVSILLETAKDWKYPTLVEIEKRGSRTLSI